MKILFPTILLAFTAAVGSSALVDALLKSRIAILGSFFGLERTVNSGIAFGMRIPGIFQILLILLALVFVAWCAIRDSKTRISQVGFGFIIGGGLANISDRLLDGFVTDFIQVGRFPVFNAADSFITIGVAVLFWEVVVKKNG